MMTNKLKRALSLMLAFCMTLGLVTTGALAEAEPEPAEDVQVEQAVPACAELAGCTGETHDEGCPLYAAPENAADDELNPPVGGSPEGTSGDQAPLTTDKPDDSAAEETEAGENVTLVEDTRPTVQQVSLDSAAAPQAELGETHIATYVGEAPEGLTGDFSDPYSTVEVDGCTVEVVPKNLVYFIDQIDYNDGTVSKPYEAVKTLVGEQLLNETYDRQTSSGNG